MFTILILPNPPEQPLFCLQAWAWQNLPRSAFEVWVLLPESANKAEFDWPTGLSGGILSPEQVPRLGATPDREVLLWEADFLPHRDLLWQLKAARSHSPTGLLQTVGTWPRPVPPAWQAALKESDLALPFAPDAFESRALAPDQVFCSGLLLPERDFQALLDAQPEFLTAAMAPMGLQALRHWLHTHLPAPSQTVF